MAQDFHNLDLQRQLQAKNLQLGRLQRHHAQLEQAHEITEAALLWCLRSEPQPGQPGSFEEGRSHRWRRGTVTVEEEL
eukprot:3759499-Prorocentrum_lima.AAC.1